jgi:hypothetical protein
MDNSSTIIVEKFTHLGHVINSNMDDKDDIQIKHDVLINQTNNVICYFKKLDSFVKYHLYRSYCMSLFGCELGSLCSNNVNDICVTWCKSVRRVWNLPFDTHSAYLPLICRSLPIFDEICRRCVNFLYGCLNSGSSLIRSITSYGIFYGRRHSFIGRNINFCLHRYKCSLADFTSGRLRYVIENSYNASVSEETRVKITFIEECIYNRDLLSKGTLRQFVYSALVNLKT